MKYTKVLGLALAALTFNACSDEWDEHYVAQPLGNGVSLWQTISTDTTLSHFKMVLDSCGYEKVLNSSQVFTVFAPTNDYFTEQQAEAYIELYKIDKEKNKKEKENRAVKEFVMNHIALYNHSVYSNYSDTIVMLNGKYLRQVFIWVKNIKLGRMFLMRQKMQLVHNGCRHLNISLVTF